MYPVNADKERIIHIVSQWLTRSGLGIEQVIARMQINGYDIARSTFENRFTTRVQQKPNIPPDCFLALVTALTERLTDEERCTASEAIEMANLARLPIDQFQDIQKQFPSDEFIAAFEQYISPLFGKTYLIQAPSDSSTRPEAANLANSATNNPTEANQPLDEPSRTEWGDSPDVTTFFGRAKELSLLSKWIQEDRCRLIAILGIGGMGKTTLAKKLAEHVQEDFDYLYWTSLRDAPSLEEVIDDLIRFFSEHDELLVVSQPERRTTTLLQLLRKKRCLLIFDGAEAVLQEGIDAGGYLEQYEDYAELFHTIGETSHNSCLILTSREKPEEFVVMETADSPVRSLPVIGLPVEAARQILHDKGLHGNDETWKRLVLGYSGNPLALKLASEPISEVYSGDIMAFLKGGVPIITGVRDLLDAHFSRLTRLERSILYWLTIEREALPPDALLDNLIENVGETELLEALRWLRRRSLIEQNASGLTLQNVVMEYMADRFIGLVVDEIEAEFPTLLTSFTLMKAQAKEYVRSSQKVLFVEPIVDMLTRRVGQSEAVRILQGMLSQLSEERRHSLALPQAGTKARSYQAGNILNLLIHMGISLEGTSLTHLEIRNVDLRGISLRDVDLSNADCTESIFTDTFGSITTSAFSPDGKLLVVGDVGGDIRLWDVASRRQVAIFAEHTDLVWGVAFSPDGQLVASCSQDQTIRLWDITAGESIATLQEHTGWVKGVTFSNDGSTLASCSNDGTIRLWDVKTRTHLRAIVAHDGWVWSIAFSPDDQFLVTSGQDGLVKLWETESDQNVQTFVGHDGAVRVVRFSPDGQWIASGSVDHTVRLWEVESGRSIVLSGHENQVWTIAFNPDGQTLASGGDDQTLRLWRVDTHEPLHILRDIPSRIWTTAFSPDGRVLVSGSDDQTLRFWDVATGHTNQILEGYSNQIWSVDFTQSTNQVASAGDDKRIYLWPIAHDPKGEKRGDDILQPILMAGHADRIRSLAFSSDGKLLVSGGDDHLVRVWDTGTQQELHQLSGHTNRVWSVAISPDQSIIASSSEDQTIRLWRLATGQGFRTIPVNHRIWSVAFSADSLFLASASDDSLIHLWSIKDANDTKTLFGHQGRVWSVCFSPDGRKLASGGDDGSVRVWDVAEGTLLQTFTGHREHVLSVAWAPDNQTIASGSDDQTIRVWDVANDECLQTIHAHDASIRSIVFGPGKTLFSGGSDEKLRQWAWENGEMLLDQRTDRPYERMNISHLTGVSQAQLETLRLLGAIEQL